MFFGTIYEYLKSSEHCSKFTGVLEDSGIMKESEENFTVFVPSNDAIDRLSQLELKVIKEDPAEFVSCHLYKGDLPTAGMYCISEIKTISVTGQTWTLDLNSVNDLVIDGKAKLKESDVVCSNGLVHIIDRVLLTTKTIKLPR